MAASVDVFSRESVIREADRLNGEFPKFPVWVVRHQGCEHYNIVDNLKIALLHSGTELIWGPQQQKQEQEQEQEQERAEAA